MKHSNLSASSAAFQRITKHLDSANAQLKAEANPQTSIPHPPDEESPIVVEAIKNTIIGPRYDDGLYPRWSF